jgi:hypothetical protein
VDRQDFDRLSMVHARDLSARGFGGFVVRGLWAKFQSLLTTKPNNMRVGTLTEEGNGSRTATCAETISSGGGEVRALFHRANG